MPRSKFIKELTPRTAKKLFHTAVERHDAEAVEFFLNRNSYLYRVSFVKARDKNGMEPLHVASMKGFANIAAVLLDHGARVDSACGTAASRKGYTSLHLAVAEDHEDVVELLLRRGADFDASAVDESTPLHVAVSNSRKTIVARLLKIGADANARDQNGKSALHLAVEKGSWTMTEWILMNGADVNLAAKDNSMPLHLAAKGKHAKIVKLLLERGADVDAQDIYCNTVLYVAVERGHPPIVHHILEARPDPKIASNRRSLDAAILGVVREKRQSIKILEALLDYGLSVDSRNVDTVINRHLLYIAVEQGRSRVAAHLLKRGADPNNTRYGSSHSASSKLWNLPKNRQYTLLGVATKNRHHEVVQLLIDHGADLNAKDSFNKTVLFYAVVNLDSSMIDMLIRNGASAMDNPDVIAAAVRMASKDFVQHVPEQMMSESDVDACDERGKASLLLTVLTGKKSYLPSIS